jgi:hypothetical protein
MKSGLPLLLVTIASAQAPSVPVSWDVVKAAVDLAAEAERLSPVLDRIDPAQWAQQGASPTYVEQWRDARTQLGYFQESARRFERTPEKLTAALDTYFRLQGIERQLASLAEGARKYQDPAAGDQLLSVMGENSANRDGLRQYIEDLAAQKEEELGVADREAQRCRATINRLPAPAPAKRTKQ